LTGRRTEPIVWIIDHQQWPRASLRAELIERGFDALGYEVVAEAVAALQAPEIERPQVIVLELREQGLDRETLGALAKTAIPTIILGGIMELNEAVVHEFAWAVVMKRPFTIGAVADQVEGLTGR
jgi:DNA-binding NtrC family response regulator